MKRWGLIVAVAMAAALSMFGAASASAATEFGDSCVGNEVTESPNTYFALSAAGDSLPLAAPSAGVITKWKVNSLAPFTFHQTLKVVRPTGAKTAMVVGEALGNVSAGTSSFDTRIPVQAGDLLGLFGTAEEFEGTPIGTLFCLLEGLGENAVGAFAGGGPGIGVSAEFIPIPAEAAFPVSAVLEPDADNDGYGDETQDKCPTSAATHDACPAPTVVAPVTLNATASAKKGLVKLLVTSNAQTQVTVAGSIKLGKHAAMTLHGGTQVVNPGTFASFVLLFPKALREKLKALSPKRSLTLKVTSTAPNSAGAVTTNELKVKLKGQAKPVGRKSKGKKA